MSESPKNLYFSLFLKKRKGPDKSFIEDAAVISGSDDDEDEEEEEDEDNNEYFRDDQQYSQNAIPADYPISSRTLFYSILSTNHILSTWLNMVWVHPNHNSLSLLNKARQQRSHACGTLCNSNFSL